MHSHCFEHFQAAEESAKTSNMGQEAGAYSESRSASGICFDQTAVSHSFAQLIKKINS